MPNTSPKHSPSPNSPFRPASISIINGSNNLFTLFDEETKKIKLQHRALLVDLESKFQRYRVSVSEHNAKANVRIKELEEKVAQLKEELLVARACQPRSCVNGCAGGLGLNGLNLNSKIPDSSPPHEMPYAVAPSVDPWADTLSAQDSCSTPQSLAPDVLAPADEHVDFVVNVAHITPEGPGTSVAANGAL